jgi:hypothetical protein
MLTRHVNKLLRVTAVMLVAACTDNNILNPLADAAGTYQLTVYAGRSIPATYIIQAGDPDYPNYPNGATLVVTDGDLVLNNNGTFVETNYYDVTPTGGTTLNQSFRRTGTWTLNGSDLTLRNAAQDVFATLTISSDGRYTINYQEDNGNGLESYEYKR